MGFSKRNRLREFPIEFEIPAYENTVFRVWVKPRLTEEADEARRALFGIEDVGEGSKEAKAAHTAAVLKASAELLATIIVRSPTEADGFEEFPTEGDLSANVAEYFNDEDLDPHINYILTRYWDAVFPRPCMKSTQGDSAGGDSAVGA